MAMSDTLEADNTQAMLQMVLDRMAIEELFVRYYSGLGTGDHEGFGGFFTDDDPELDVNGVICRSADDITRLYRDVAQDKPNLTGTFRMILSNLIIEVQGDTAKAQMLWTQTLNDTVKAPPRLIEQGREYDLLVKKAGRWKIKKRVVIADSNLPDMMDTTYTPRADYSLASL
jgi:hypothetical protein